MDPDRRTCHRGGDRQVGLSRQGSEYGPHERALTLLIGPWVEMVGDPQRFEACLLRALRLPDELARLLVLGGQEIAEACHRLSRTRDCAFPPRYPAAVRSSVTGRDRQRARPVAVRS